MADLQTKFLLVRKAIFGVASLFSLLVIVLSALIINYTTSNSIFGWYYPFTALGIATGLLTLFTLPAMVWLSMNRKGAITSMLVIEIGWTWFLWIMWLSVGGSAATYNWGACTGLGYSYIKDNFESSCREGQALTAFAFLTWIMLFAYNIALIGLSVRQYTRGNTAIWTSYVDEVNFDAAGTSGHGQTDGKFAPQYGESVNTVNTPQQQYQTQPGTPYTAQV